MALFFLLGRNAVARFSTRPINLHLTSFFIHSQRLNVLATNDDDDKQSPTLSPPKNPSSPWLILPTQPTDDNHKLYSLKENKLHHLTKKRLQPSAEENYNYKIVGSSHGWLALFDPSNCDLFLSNPTLARHHTIKLPPIRTLPYIPTANFDQGQDCVTNVIISSSSPPCNNINTIDQDCRAVMIYGPRNRLSFCSPACGDSKWTHLGDRLGYQSCVYSPTQKLFFCCYNKWEFYNSETRFEAWDLRDPLSPRLIPMKLSFYPKPFQGSTTFEWERTRCQVYESLVVVDNDDDDDQILHVKRFVMHYDEESRKRRSYDPKRKGRSYYTFGFEVRRYDPVTGSMRFMDRSLDGLALFVGSSNGFGLRTDEFPELKPDSIYYTAPPRWRCPIQCDDVGIYNYREQTFSPCFYPCDLQSSVETTNKLMWYDPPTKGPKKRVPPKLKKDATT